MLAKTLTSGSGNLLNFAQKIVGTYNLNPEPNEY